MLFRFVNVMLLLFVKMMS